MGEGWVGGLLPFLHNCVYQIHPSQCLKAVWNCMLVIVYMWCMGLLLVAASMGATWLESGRSYFRYCLHLLAPECLVCVRGAFECCLYNSLQLKWNHYKLE